MAKNSSEEGLLVVGNRLIAVDEAEGSGAGEGSDNTGTDASHDGGGRALLSGGLLSEDGGLNIEVLELLLDGAAEGVGKGLGFLAHLSDYGFSVFSECFNSIFDHFVERISQVPERLKFREHLAIHEILDCLFVGAVIGDHNLFWHFTLLLLHGLVHGLALLADEDLLILLFHQLSNGFAFDGHVLDEVGEQLVAGNSLSSLAILTVKLPFSAKTLHDGGKGLNGLLNERIFSLVERIKRGLDFLELGKVERGLVLHEGHVVGLLVDALAHEYHLLLHICWHIKSFDGLLHARLPFRVPHAFILSAGIPLCLHSCLNLTPLKRVLIFIRDRLKTGPPAAKS